jgi:hypothetical protein
MATDSLLPTVTIQRLKGTSLATEIINNKRHTNYPLMVLFIAPTTVSTYASSQWHSPVIYIRTFLSIDEWDRDSFWSSYDNFFKAQGYTLFNLKQTPLGSEYYEPVYGLLDVNRTYIPSFPDTLIQTIIILKYADW